MQPRVGFQKAKALPSSSKNVHAYAKGSVSLHLEMQAHNTKTNTLCCRLQPIPQQTTPPTQLRSHTSPGIAQNKQKCTPTAVSSSQPMHACLYVCALCSMPAACRQNHPLCVFPQGCEQSASKKLADQCNQKKHLQRPPGPRAA